MTDNKGELDITNGGPEIRWPSDHPGASYDWYEFSVKGDSEEHGELLRVKVNVSFMLSTWKCIFGQGCPGVLISGAMEDRGCCQIGVHMENTTDDYKRVRGYVEQLTEEDLDADRLKVVKSNNGKGWRYRDTSGEDGASTLEGYEWHTKVVDGACVLANRAGGSTGKLGCSLHVLANRLGLHHSDTKPNICWQIPMAITEEYDEDLDQTVMTVDGTPAAVWGSTNMRSLHSPGWWCTETPDAYVTGNSPETDEVSLEYGMVFRTNEIELRRMMTDRVYDEMAKHLKLIIQSGGRRVPMPGERIADGKKLLPLIVPARLAQWVDDESPDSMKALKRSEPWMQEHASTPSGYRPTRRLARRTVQANQVSSTGETIEDVEVTTSVDDVE